MLPDARRLRFALVIYGSLDTRSGGYLYDRMLVRGLEQRGHSVELISSPWRNYARHLADNFSPAWHKRIRAVAADVILQDELNHPSLALVNLGRRRKSPPVVSIVHHLRTSEQHSPLLMPLYRAVERRYLRSVDAFIFNSATTQASVAALVGEKGLPGLIAYPGGDHVLAAGYSSSLCEPRQAQFVVLFVGNLIPRKRLHVVLEALARMPTAATLHVVGSAEVDPAYARRMRTLVEHLGISERVVFHGAVSDADRARLFACADVLAVPSYEGFGIVYLEAMAFGCPVIAASAGAAREIVTEGQDGFLVPLDDAAAVAMRLNALASDAALLKRMGGAARARFQRHPTWDETTGRIAGWLEGLCT